MNKDVVNIVRGVDLIAAIILNIRELIYLFLKLGYISSQPLFCSKLTARSLQSTAPAHLTTQHYILNFRLFHVLNQ